MELATVSGGGNNLALELYLARGSSEILGRILGDPSTISVRGWAPASPGAKPWNHGAVVYNGTDGTLTVFANGKRIGQATGALRDRMVSEQAAPCGRQPDGFRASPRAV